MGVNVVNFMENKNVVVLDEKGPYSTIAYKQDMSISPATAQEAFFCAKMNMLKRQLVINLGASNGGITLQAGAMQWMAGNVQQTTGIKGVGDLVGKMFSSKVTGESAIKPEYVGDGILVTEPTYKYLILIDVANDFQGAVTVEDGMYLSTEKSLQLKTVARTSLSSAVAGGEGLFNLSFMGNGIACVESRVPEEEIVKVQLQNDEIKIDGSYAIAWSNSLQFTVERSGKSLIGSAASGEGLVNVYRGTGTVWMAPI